MIAPTATRQARRRYGGLSHRFLDSVDLPLLSRHHFTAPPSPKRYDNRYEVEGRTNFLELRTGEVRRISLLSTWVNKVLCSRGPAHPWAPHRDVAIATRGPVASSP